MNKHSIRAAALALVLSGACQSSFDKARDLDTAEAYRDFLRENPQDPSTEAARARLSELEFLDARRQHTLPAYKRFLTSFPDMPRAQDAKLLIEGIRFEMAAEKDTSEAWLIFLREHSQGPHAQEARRRLEDADYRAVQQATSARQIREFLGRHPQTERRSELEKRLDEFEFQEARARGTRGLSDYLASNPVGVHRDEVREEIFAREAWASARLGDFASARRLAERVVSEAPRQALIERVDKAEIDWLTAELDVEALAAFASAREAGPIQELALFRVAFLRGLGTAELSRLRSSVDPGHFARPVGEMIGVLKAADPRERWLAADELGQVGDLAAVEALLEEVSRSRFSRVRHRAFDAMRRLFAILPEDTVDLTARSRLQALDRKAAQDVGLFVKLGVVRELLGDVDAALLAYESALRLDAEEMFALRRTIELNARSGKAFRTGVLARELAFRARQHAERWTGVEVEAVNPLLLSRTLCGTLDDARFALERLKSLSPEALVDLSDDAPRFIAQAEESERFIAARLADAEAEARSLDRSFRACADEGEQVARLQEGEQARLQAVETIAARADLLRTVLLERLSLRDPSPRVREKAAQALESDVAPKAAEASAPSVKRP